ncbi:MAG: Gfo/Idh/MocA family oxidoreductase [Gammaproteobacteria bacterium]|nr:Gfo/Idh/MocA family oxidoreductase [Gammaproteobacteria bacterium]
MGTQDRLRIGILGTGRMAHAFATGLRETQQATLVATGSRAADTAKQFADEFGIHRAHASYDALAEDPDVDLIYISSPHSLHSEHCLLCLDAGKAVLCEKPFAINAIEARAVIESAKKKQLFMMEAMWTRFIPAVCKLRELIARETIGDAKLLVAGGAYMPEFDPAVYLFRPDLGGGVLLDAGVYLVSMASMIFGSPHVTLATGTIGDHRVDDHDGILLRHANGAISSLYVSLKAKASPEATIFGSRGRIHVHPPLFAPAALTVSIDGEADETIELPVAGNGYHYQVEEVVRCMAAGNMESTVMPLAETLEIMETMDTVRQQVGLSYPMEG